VLSRHDPSELVVPAVLEPVPRLEVDHVSQNTQNSLERVIAAVPEVAPVRFRPLTTRTT